MNVSYLSCDRIVWGQTHFTESEKKEYENEIIRFEAICATTAQYWVPEFFCREAAAMTSAGDRTNPYDQ